MASIVDTLPYDLIATIVDFVAEEDENDKKTLKACSLTCRTFLPPCQKIIFRCIKLTDFRLAARLTHRFARTIEKSPWLADYVRQFEWLVMKDHFNPSSSVPTAFKHLTKLEVLTLDHQLVAPFRLGVGSDWRRLPESMKCTLLHLMQLPTIISLTLPSQGHGFNLFELSPCINLKNLYMLATSLGHQNEISLCHRARPIRLQQLQLHASATPIIVPMLRKSSHHSTRLPFLDFTELKTLTLVLDKNAFEETTGRFLRCAYNLEILNLLLYMPDVTAQTLGLLLFANISTVKSLTLFISLNDSFDVLYSFSKMLEELSKESNCLRNLTIHFRLFQGFTLGYDTFVIGGHWGLLEDSLLSPGWSSLEEVDIKVAIKNLRPEQLPEALEELNLLPESDLRGLSSTKSFNFKFAVSVSQSDAANWRSPEVTHTTSSMARAAFQQRAPRAQARRETADELLEELIDDVESTDAEQRHENQSVRPILPIGHEISLELVGVILKHIDDKPFLLRSRLISRKFKSAADPFAFRTLTVSRTQQSREGFQNLIASPQLAAFVQQIIFVTSGKGARTDDAINEGVLSDLECIPKFPSVNALQLRFLGTWSEDEDEPDEMSPARQLQIAAIRTLSTLHSQQGLRLQSLEIHNLITRTNESILTDEFKSLLETLTSLTISLLTNDSELFYHSDEDYCQFWDRDMTTMLNAARNLASLTLVSDIKTFCDWDKFVTFLKLESLTLENFVFGELFSPEPFILRHKETLLHLELLSCWNQPDSGLISATEPRAWADIFKRFEEELIGLLTFSFNPLPGIEEGTEDHPQWHGYVYADTEGSEGGYKNFFNEKPLPQAGEGDISAFRSFQEVIAKRTE
ncbi:hypothetical protein JR316_0005845 [Psilocybe cubensis]|uniref:Uncharacterized protein n=2 Tax=Psilocybe cubensis TaxID=181762 RepID=A0ACB8GZZ0_PSICU|nr:hypothetical protein JR316_0005845 [Psilocybe cubensis]KAH9481323.1 hypothetical protein JR316_0005845 [Psilocybe cubensis]